MDTIAQRIKKKRLELELTQEQLGKRLGLSRVAITKWENGETENLKLDNLRNLCNVFNCSVEYLIDGKEQESKKHQINDITNIYSVIDILNSIFKNKKESIDKEYLDVINEVLKVKKDHLKQLKTIVSSFVDHEINHINNKKKAK